MDAITRIGDHVRTARRFIGQHFWCSPYTQHSIYPPDALLRNGQPFVPERSHFLAQLRQAIERLKLAGLIQSAS